MAEPLRKLDLIDFVPDSDGKSNPIVKDTDEMLYFGVGAKYRVDNGWGLRLDGRIQPRAEQVPVRRAGERVAPEGLVEGDSGEVETLEDGSISIPVFEEQLVIPDATGAIAHGTSTSKSSSRISSRLSR